MFNEQLNTIIGLVDSGLQITVTLHDIKLNDIPDGFVLSHYFDTHTGEKNFTYKYYNGFSSITIFPLKNNVK